jgi:hypothetical protein
MCLYGRLHVSTADDDDDLQIERTDLKKEKKNEEIDMN